MNDESWEKVEALFQAALELAPELRAAFVDQVCEGNPELQHQLEELLVADAQASNFLESVPIGEDSNPQTAGPLIDEQIGPYRIVSLLGAGGMGKVFRALDTRLDRPVAIKFSSEHFNKRFEQEARAISSLNHPHICTLYDVGVAPSGSGYIVTELVEGQNLGLA